MLKKRAIAHILLSIFFIATYAQDFNIKYSSPEILGKINDYRIVEASGLAASYNTPGAFWVHNDSGDGSNIFLVDSTGKTLSSGSVFNTTSRDWEDIASFVIDDQPYLLIADVGDNPINKSEYWLYIIEEPVYDENNATGNSYSLVRTIEFQYENGSQNCESVAVDPHQNKIILVSKSGNGNNERFVYEIPLSVENGKELTTAKRIGQFPMEGTTAMDISNDGQRAIVLTYEDAYEFIRFAGNRWQDAFSSTPRKIPMPQRPGGEAIAYGVNGVDLYLVREGESSPVWYLKGNQDQGAVFQVDMYENKEDIYENQVWLNIMGSDTAIAMTDTDHDFIYSSKIDLITDSNYHYFYSYLNVSLDTINEKIPESCTNENEHRTIYISNRNIHLKPYLFGTCNERPYYVTVAVDLKDVTDFTENGKVWVKTFDPDSLYEMQNTNVAQIYTCTLSGPKGSVLKYKFGYQNGSLQETDQIFEIIPSECSNEGGYRTFLMQYEQIELLSVLFGSCQEALPQGTDVTDLTGVRIMGSNDDEPWLGATSGAGSPDGQEVDKLIDNDVGSKYLLRAMDSWVDIVLPNLTKVTAYTITSGSDVPSRDPHSWEFQGWNRETNQWETIHTVVGNPEWQQRLQRKSWYFENNQWYGKYRLHIHEINGNSQNLMQMSEFQIFGDVGEDVEWSENARLKSLTVRNFELDPAFDPAVFDYHVTLPTGTISINIDATPEDEHAKVDGTGSYLLILLTEDPQITVTAENGVAKNTYNVSYSFADDETSLLNKEYKSRIYPIPANEKLFIEITNIESFDYEIYTIQGKLIKTGYSVKENFIMIDLSNFTNGFHILKLDFKDKSEIHKIVIHN